MWSTIRIHTRVLEIENSRTFFVVATPVYRPYHANGLVNAIRATTQDFHLNTTTKPLVLFCCHKHESADPHVLALCRRQCFQARGSPNGNLDQRSATTTVFAMSVTSLALGTIVLVVWADFSRSFDRVRDSILIDRITRPSSPVRTAHHCLCEPRFCLLGRRTVRSDVATPKRFLNGSPCKSA